MALLDDFDMFLPDRTSRRASDNGAGDYWSKNIQYPATSMMGLLTGAAFSEDQDPSGWGRPVSLEGSPWPAPRHGAPDDSPRDASPSGPARSGGADIAKTSSGTDAKGPSGSFLNRLGDFFNNNSMALLGMGAGLAGAPSVGVGLGRGFQYAMQGIKNDQTQRAQNATVQALTAKGIDPKVATAAAQNPTILAQLVGQVFGPKQLQHVVLTDKFGDQHIYAFDPSSGKAQSIMPTGVAKTDVSSDLHGDDYLKTLDPTSANFIRAVADGRASLAGRNLQRWLPMVTQYDPTFDATNYQSRANLRKQFVGGGKNFQEGLALNTVSGHMLDLADAADKLNNSNFVPWNRLRNLGSDYIRTDPALSAFRFTLTTTMNELTKAYHGGHVTDAAFAAFNKGINEAQSPDAMREVIGTAAHMLHSKIQANEEGYKSGMRAGATLPEEYDPISKRAHDAFDYIHDWAAGVPSAKPRPAGMKTKAETPEEFAARAMPRPAAASSAPASAPAPLPPARPGDVRPGPGNTSWRMKPGATDDTDPNSWERVPTGTPGRRTAFPGRVPSQAPIDIPGQMAQREREIWNQFYARYGRLPPGRPVAPAVSAPTIGPDGIPRVPIRSATPPPVQGFE